ncbi:nuclear transport factor 2 family protein [Mycolicibacterium sp. Y3]
MTLHHRKNAQSEWDALPAIVKTYLTAHAAGEDSTVLSVFAADAVVTDEGHDHVGHEQINAWLTGPAGEYTYTTEFAGATVVDAENVHVLQHLEGNFPGGVADLRYRFSLAGALISRLVIEP